MRARPKHIAVGLLLVALVALALSGVKALQIVAMVEAEDTPPPVAVTTATAEMDEWPVAISGVGSLVAVHGATLSTEIAGTVVHVGFDTGEHVDEGQVVLRLDGSAERAALESARAEAALARQAQRRFKPLAGSGSISGLEMDEVESEVDRTRAVVERLEATLDKKTIHAPFAGRVGVRRVDRGDVLSPGTPIVTLYSEGSIYAELQLPEQSLATLREGQPARVRADAVPDREWKGRVDSIDASVDSDTRTVTVRALIDNTGGTLRPGMFVNVEVVQPDPRRVLRVPSSAVLYAPYGSSIFVVEEDGSEDGPLTATRRLVRLGERRGDFVEVIDGLEAGEQIVSTGAFKLESGSRVTVENDLAPEPELSPTPENR